MFEGLSDLIWIANVTGFNVTGFNNVTDEIDPLETFVEMWYLIFIWALISSILVHTLAALWAFVTLRRHHVGRFFPLFILLMGVVTPGTSGFVTSAVISFLYSRSPFQSLHMNSFYAFLFGVGQTVIVVAFSFIRILGTL